MRTMASWFEDNRQGWPRSRLSNSRSSWIAFRLKIGLPGKSTQNLTGNDCLSIRSGPSTLTWLLIARLSLWSNGHNWATRDRSWKGEVIVYSCGLNVIDCPSTVRPGDGKMLLEQGLGAYCAAKALRIDALSWYFLACAGDPKKRIHEFCRFKEWGWRRGKTVKIL